ncbi:MAG: hypothetical protein LUQ35_04020 [Methanoregula sp.]|nr:hypothetical protein [Methanoregula sp.]
MKKKIPYPLILCFVGAFVLFCGCSQPVPHTGTPTATFTPVPTSTGDPTTCTNDSQCVSAQCCHPTSCINSLYKQPCTQLCTAVCTGPIDCGAGHCGCVEGKCQVIPGPDSLP